MDTRKLNSIQHKGHGLVHLAFRENFAKVATMKKSWDWQDTHIAAELAVRWNEYPELKSALDYLSGKLQSLCDTMPDQDPGEPRDSDLSRCRHIIDDMQSKLEEYQPTTTA